MPWPFYPQGNPVSIVQEVEWVLGPVWTSEKNLTFSGVRTPNNPARNLLGVNSCLIAKFRNIKKSSVLILSKK